MQGLPAWILNLLNKLNRLPEGSIYLKLRVKPGSLTPALFLTFSVL